MDDIEPEERKKIPEDILVLIFDDSYKKEDEESNKDERSFNKNFFLRLFEKFSECIRKSKKDHFVRVEDEFEPWIFDKIIEKRLSFI